MHRGLYQLRLAKISDLQKVYFRILYFCVGQPGKLEEQEARVVAGSSAEAEYRAMSLEICEEIWLQTV